ncbi:hypothetical protein ACJRO7_007666 [Eucalyptus globulus]|uniref:Uncharacterized protein n=1 Tax=Eucalyptus globulus TaxID=34317 RepID=A0ABD3ILW1_EUCGL
MENPSLGAGLIAVCAVSGGVVLLSLQLHKCLLSDFMKEIEFHFLARRQNNATNPSWNDNGCPTRRIPKPDKGHRFKSSDQCVMEDRNLELESMPVNRQMLYRGILLNKHLRGHFVPRHF